MPGGACSPASRPPFTAPPTDDGDHQVPGPVAPPPSGGGLEVPGLDDAPDLQALDAACFPDPWSVEGWRAEVVAGDRRWLVVRDGGRVVALGGLWLAPDAAHVLRLAVAPARRGRGLAVRLVTGLVGLAEAAGRPALTLEVRASNRAALNLYRRLDFVSHGLRPGYYADGEDAVVLWRTAPTDATHDAHGR